MREGPQSAKVCRFLVAIHFYVQGNYQKSAGVDLHYTSVPAVSRCIKVIKAIVNHFTGRLIKFPTTVPSINEIKIIFFRKFQSPSVIGITDGIHISIIPPVFGLIPSRYVYINCKNFYSINCQIICDAYLRILAISARYPGSDHDSAIWLQSNMFQHLRVSYHAGERFSWLLGDSGYPLQPFLLTPIPDASLNTPEGRYTTALTITCATLHNTLRNDDVQEKLYEHDDGEIDHAIDVGLLQADQKK